MDLEKKIITITDVAQKALPNGSILISLHDEKGLKYSFFTKKKDGSPTKAYEDFKHFNVMDKVDISFESSNQEFEGKPYVRRTIRTFRPGPTIEKGMTDEEISAEDILFNR